MTAPFPILPLLLLCLPGLVALVGLCLLGLVPRESRVLAALGLIPLVLAAFVEVLLYVALFRILIMNGLHGVPDLLGQLSRSMVVVGLVFLALAATRRRPGPENGAGVRPPHRSHPPLSGGL